MKKKLINLSVEERFMPDGKCPIVRDFKTPIRHYSFCLITGIVCYGDFFDRPQDCPIVAISELN